MASKYQKLLSKHVLIIGGTSGIGFSVAEAALASGASVTVSSSTTARVDKAIASLKESFSPDKVSGYVCDLSKPSLEQDIEDLFSKVGNVDHIVFSAGDRLANLPLAEISLDKIIAAGQVRFFAPLLVAKVGSRYLSAGPESSIILTTGLVSEHPNPNWSVIASYAAGLHGMTRNLALDLKPIRVNCVSPGLVDTNLWRHLPSEARDANLRSAAAKLPTGRIGKPEDVAEAYLWLLKDPNVTGSVVSDNSGALLV
ncbi:tropinone reductase-like protein 3 [Coleophoma crateriformis]|uniref:Tropinone reductase-like protein 3 n=1 Tax=Coleophoma crateriformis TaxID=565419 RepID=A0A3D8QYW2_9HELO|nr:tropinone reductase-like protein 3 [Coleophoma crateriformis]